jgi:hypothetical protein
VHQAHAQHAQSKIAAWHQHVANSVAAAQQAHQAKMAAHAAAVAQAQAAHQAKWSYHHKAAGK